MPVTMEYRIPVRDGDRRRKGILLFFYSFLVGINLELCLFQYLNITEWIIILFLYFYIYFLILYSKVHV